MKIVAMVCPNCNGHLDIQEGKKYSFCPYCGVKLLIDDGSRTYNYHETYHRIDDAEIERARVEAEAVRARETVRLKELELQEKKRTRSHRIILIWIIIMVVLGAIGFFKPITWVIDFILFIYGFIAFLDHSEKEKEIEISARK